MSEYFLLLFATVVVPVAALVALVMWFVRAKAKGGGNSRPPSS